MSDYDSYAHWLRRRDIMSVSRDIGRMTVNELMALEGMLKRQGPSPGTITLTARPLSRKELSGDE